MKAYYEITIDDVQEELLPEFIQFMKYHEHLNDSEIIYIDNEVYNFRPIELQFVLSGQELSVGCTSNNDWLWQRAKRNGKDSLEFKSWARFHEEVPLFLTDDAIDRIEERCNEIEFFH